MREILFRGKSFGGVWEYGVPVFCGVNNELAFMKQMHSYDHQVMPETVGQFTGLTDMNGKKIFEGDLVKAERICNGDAWVGNVVWWNGCFAIQGVKDKNVPAIDLFREYEVIGNIHDNPELLNGGVEDG